MQIIDINIESVSRDVAQCNAVVLKVNESFRYLFIPRLVDNSKDMNKCISGKFIVQKKGKNEQWEDYKNLAINKLAKGEWINLDLSTASMDIFIQYIENLKEIYIKNGKYDSFGTTRTFVFSNKLDSDEKAVILEMFNKDESLKNVLKSIVFEDIKAEDIIKTVNNGKINLTDVTNGLGLKESNEIYSILKAKLINPYFLEQNYENTDEKFWQQLLKNNPNIISTLIPSVIHIIEDQPYMGGKAIDNKGASIADFLYNSGTDNVSIVEIKTPSTDLLGNEYRKNVYCPSKELSGAIVQIRRQKDGFIKEYNSIKLESQKKDVNFSAYDPKSYILIGNSKDLNSYQIESFELFRNSLKDVEIITFNELVYKLKIFQKYLKVSDNDIINF